MSTETVQREDADRFGPAEDANTIGLEPEPTEELHKNQFGSEQAGPDSPLEWVAVGDGGARFMRVDLDHLLARAVAPEVAWREGLRSVDEAEGRRLTGCSNFSGGGLAIAYPFVDDAYTRLQLHDRAGNQGKTRARPGVTPPPYVLSTMTAEATTTAYVVEAPVKALAMESAGFTNCVGCGGVNAGIFMKGTRELQPLVRRFIPPGRPVTIVFDAGRANNERVAAAEAAVARALLDYGCPVRVAELPPAEGGADQGPDDFLAAEGPEAMRALLAAARPAEPGQWARAAVAEGPAHARALLAHLPFAAALAAGGPGAQRDAADALKDYTTKRDVTAAARQFSDRLAALRKAGREKREGAQENGAASEIILERGDQVEIAEEHVKRIGAPVAFDEGKTFAYRGGWWRPVSDAKQIAAITTFAGALVGAGEDRRVLSLRHDACVGALKLSQALTARPGFFAGAPSGLAFQDGFLVLDGAKAKLVPHDEDHRARFAYRFAYDPGAPCPVWERYLATVWLGDDDAAEKGKALQEFVGACLFGAATTFKTTCLLYGDSDSGKSTALDVVRGVFPPGTTAAVSLHDFEQEYRRARLAGMLLNVVAEMPSADLLRSEAFKAIVAGDVIEGRRIYQEPFDFAPRAGHLFAANTLPHVSDRSGAVWARWMVISFNREFDRTGTRPDLPQAEHGLAKRILAGERPGVVAWAVRGCARLAAAGRYTRPGSTEKLIASWRKDSDPVEQWFDEMIDTKDPRHAMTPTSLYSSYQGWAGLAGYRQPVAIVTFSRTLERLLQGRTGRPAVRRTVKGYRLFVGVRIREPVLQPDPVDPDCEMDEDPLVH